MLRREFEIYSYPKEVEELMLKILKQPRKRNAAIFLGTEKPLLLPAPKAQK